MIYFADRQVFELGDCIEVRSYLGVSVGAVIVNGHECKFIILELKGKAIAVRHFSDVLNALDYVWQVIPQGVYKVKAFGKGNAFQRGYMA